MVDKYTRNHPQTRTRPPTQLVCLFQTDAYGTSRLVSLDIHTQRIFLPHRSRVPQGRPTLGHTVFLRTGTPNPTVHPPLTHPVAQPFKAHRPAQKLQTQVLAPLHITWKTHHSKEEKQTPGIKHTVLIRPVLFSRESDKNANNILHRYTLREL